MFVNDQLFLFTACSGQSRTLGIRQGKTTLFWHRGRDSERDNIQRTHYAYY